MSKNHLDVLSEFLKVALQEGNTCVESVTATMHIAGKFLQFLMDNKVVSDSHAKSFVKDNNISPDVFNMVLKILSLSIKIVNQIDTIRKVDEQKKKASEPPKTFQQNNSFNSVIDEDQGKHDALSGDITHHRPPIQNSLVWTIFIPGTTISHGIKLEPN